MNIDRINQLRKDWEAEEKTAHIHGWDFSHINNRYESDDDLPWDYRKIINENRTDSMKLLDYDTGGGEFLLSLGHPYGNTAATEGYPPNVELCRKELLPLGIDFKACDNASDVPFADNSFDMIINRHGDFDPEEIFRMLRPNGMFITEQVGADNDLDLVKMVLPDMTSPFPELRLSIQKKKAEDAGLKVIRAEEAFRPICFYDIGAFVWFAHIIEWEFPGFSVERCFGELLKMQEKIDKNGVVEGSVHRFLIVARK